MKGRHSVLWWNTGLFFYRTPNRIRTCDLLLRRQTLYPLSYRGVPKYVSTLKEVLLTAETCQRDPLDLNTIRGRSTGQRRIGTVTPEELSKVIAAQLAAAVADGSIATSVAGIALATIYAENGPLGSVLKAHDIEVAYNPNGVLLALIFIGLPFVVRTVQPVLADLEREVEEAAAGLGASRWQTFVKVILPHILPALLTGFAMAFARAVGEYGSVIFIAGNMPLISEITPLLIISKLEQYDFVGATALASVMLVISFVMLLAINLLQWWASNRHRSVPVKDAAAPGGAQ